jgi:uncharacterized membrane protein YccC
MSRTGLRATDQAPTDRPADRLIPDALRAAGPALLFGLRLWAATSLALYVAFWLELDNAYWAATTAAIVCQPSLGASLRKASFRMIGTAIGAVAIVILAACFSQDRIGFLTGLAVWSAACGFTATILRNFASYGAALAGVTAVVIASDVFGATGGVNGEIFTLALTRSSEICIGIVCASIVLVGTDFGRARRRLAIQFAALCAEITGGLAGTLAKPIGEEMRSVRRDLIRRVIALDPVIDEAIGENSDLYHRSRGLQAPLEGLFTALSGWRMVANHLKLLPNDQRQQEADKVLRGLPRELRSAPVQGDATHWIADPARLQRVCAVAVRALVALPADTPSLRLLADGTAEALTGMSRALNGMLMLTASDHGGAQPRVAQLQLGVPDLLPALVDATRVFIVIGVVELFWIGTAWPSGASAVTWSAIFVITSPPNTDQAYAIAKGRLLGISLAAALAAIVKFAMLPGSETFHGLGIAIGLVLVPVGVLSALRWQEAAVFGATASWFIPLMAPANQMTYDTLQFYNSALAIIAGAGAATVAFRLLPPLSPALRARRLLALTLRDLRRLATAPIPPPRDGWESRVYSRLAMLPEQAEPLQRAQLVAALSVGTETIRLRRLARRIDLAPGFEGALNAVARGNSAAAIKCLAEIDRILAALPIAGRRASITLRARASIRAISEALAQHATYFGVGETA